MAPPRHLLAIASLGIALGVAAVALRRPADAISPEPAPSASAPASVSASALASADDPASAMAARALPQPDDPQPDDSWDRQPDQPGEPGEPRPLDPKWAAIAVGPATQALVKQFVDAARPGLKFREISGKDSYDIVVEPASKPRLRRLKELAASIVESRLAEVAAVAGSDPLPGQGLDPVFSQPLKPTDDSNRELIEPVVYLETKVLLEGRLFAAIVGLGISGGPDCEMVLFERAADGKYRRSMVVAQHDFDSIQGGMLGLDVTARALPRGGYHVMTVHSTPWISSAWRGAHLQIFEPTGDPARPRRLLAEHNSARIGDKGADIAATSDGFVARFSSWTQFRKPDDDTARTHVRHFAFSGGGYGRVGPYVDRARDLPDEWLNRPWAEAQLFSASETREVLHDAHRNLSTRKAREEMGDEPVLKRFEDRLELHVVSKSKKLCPTFVIKRWHGEPFISEVIERQCEQGEAKGQSL